MFVLVLMACKQNAHAQRGVVVDDATPPQTASSGIAGFFDTETNQKGNLVFDFPTLTLDYGVTDRLTVGTNVISLISLTDVLASKATNTITLLQAKTRYRLFTTHDWSAAVTGYLGFLSTLKETDKIEEKNRQNAYLPAFTFNAAHTFEGGSWGLSYASLYLSEDKSERGSIDYSSSERHATVVSIWWRHQISSSIDSEFLLATCPSLEQKNITSTIRLDTRESCFGPRKIDPLLRGLVSWRSSQQWLFSGGVLWIPGGRIKLLPVLAFNYLTEIFPQDEDEK